MRALYPQTQIQLPDVKTTLVSLLHHVTTLGLTDRWIDNFMELARVCVTHERSKLVIRVSLTTFCIQQTDSQGLGIPLLRTGLCPFRVQLTSTRRQTKHVCASRETYGGLHIQKYGLKEIAKDHRSWIASFRSSSYITPSETIVFARRPRFGMLHQRDSRPYLTLCIEIYGTARPDI